MRIAPPRFAEVGVGCRDGDLAVGEIEPYAAITVAGHQRHALNGVPQLASPADDFLVVVARDDAVVVGKGPFENATDHFAAAAPESEVVLAAAELERAFAFEPQQLLQRLARHQDLVVRRLDRQRRVDQRQAVAVGGHDLDPLALELEQRAGELEARLLARHREEHLAYQAAELSERNGEGRLALYLRQAREIGRRQTVDAEA